LQGGEDSSSKETAIPCCLLRDWLCFNDSEEQDNAKGGHNKEGEADNINEGDGENDEKGEEGVGGTIDTRILEEMRDTSCEFFDVLPTPADNVTKGQIDVSIFLTKNIQIRDLQQITNSTHLLSGVSDILCFTLQVYFHGFLHSKWLMPPNRKGHRIQTGQCERDEL